MFAAGVDVGSRTTKGVILDGSGRIAAQEIRETGVRVGRAAEEVLESCLRTAGIGRAELAAVISTGYGKALVASTTGRLTEIACHARGARWLCPGTRTVIDIGGQDSKVIRLAPGGEVEDFAMNDRCAAGTGRFLEFMAGVLERGLVDMAATSHDPLRTRSINSVCTVFAESEVLSLVAEGCPVEEIIRGLHGAVAERTAALARKIGMVPPLTMTGGVAGNKGVVAALEERIGRKLQVPPEHQIAGALGAALEGLRARPGAPQGCPSVTT